jgi:riboflavin transporter FmnP
VGLRLFDTVTVSLLVLVVIRVARIPLYQHFILFPLNKIARGHTSWIWPFRLLQRGLAGVAYLIRHVVSMA